MSERMLGNSGPQGMLGIAVCGTHRILETLIPGRGHAEHCHWRKLVPAKYFYVVSRLSAIWVWEAYREHRLDLLLPADHACRS